MDPNAVKLALISVLLAVGAFHLLPPILKSVVVVVKEILEIVGEFVLWFREWRERIWPGGVKNPVDKPA